ncbi:MAG TPA: hypothetical protein VEI02_15730 [Planctomycetota bacterium]|nr:hypothetical protein [Planctomycetota bacterium]
MKTAIDAPRRRTVNDVVPQGELRPLGDEVARAAVYRRHIEGLLELTRETAQRLGSAPDLFQLREQLMELHGLTSE